MSFEPDEKELLQLSQDIKLRLKEYEEEYRSYTQYGVVLEKKNSEAMTLIEDIEQKHKALEDEIKSIDNASADPYNKLNNEFLKLKWKKESWDQWKLDLLSSIDSLKTLEHQYISTLEQKKEDMRQLTELMRGVPKLQSLSADLIKVTLESDSLQKFLSKTSKEISQEDAKEINEAHDELRTLIQDYQKARAEDETFKAFVDDLKALKKHERVFQAFMGYPFGDYKVFEKAFSHDFIHKNQGEVFTEADFTSLKHINERNLYYEKFRYDESSLYQVAPIKLDDEYPLLTMTQSNDHYTVSIDEEPYTLLNNEHPKAGHPRGYIVTGDIKRYNELREQIQDALLNGDRPDVDYDKAYNELKDIKTSIYSHVNGWKIAKDNMQSLIKDIEDDQKKLTQLGFTATDYDQIKKNIRALNQETDVNQVKEKLSEYKKLWHKLQQNHLSNMVSQAIHVHENLPERIQSLKEFYEKQSKANPDDMFYEETFQKLELYASKNKIEKKEVYDPEEVYKHARLIAKIEKFEQMKSCVASYDDIMNKIEDEIASTQHQINAKSKHGFVQETEKASQSSETQYIELLKAQKTKIMHTLEKLKVDLNSVKEFSDQIEKTQFVIDETTKIKNFDKKIATWTYGANLLSGMNLSDGEEKTMQEQLEPIKKVLSGDCKETREKNWEYLFDVLNDKKKPDKTFIDNANKKQTGAFYQIVEKQFMETSKWVNQIRAFIAKIFYLPKKPSSVTQEYKQTYQNLILEDKAPENVSENVSGIKPKN